MQTTFHRNTVKWNGFNQTGNIFQDRFRRDISPDIKTRFLKNVVFASTKISADIFVIYVMCNNNLDLLEFLRWQKSTWAKRGFFKHFSPGRKRNVSQRSITSIYRNLSAIQRGEQTASKRIPEARGHQEALQRNAVSRFRQSRCFYRTLTITNTKCYKTILLCFQVPQKVVLKFTAERAFRQVNMRCNTSPF